MRGSGGQMLVMPPVVDTAGQRTIRGDVQRKPVPLATFEAGVRAVMERSAAGASALRRIEGGARN